MVPDPKEPHRFRVKLLFGLFEADASGTVAICATVVLFVLLSAARYAGIW